ncbi:MAG: Holliday junction branch migration protein RuvA [Clostridia bacterium]|nr:Holliday junction branch migration protein RuvA [Clostridia bacterium]
MFYSVSGVVEHIDADSVAVDCSGVSFLCHASANTLAACGGEGSRVKLYTFLSVKEDALDLYGFISKKELELFKLLIGVSGIGSKTALAVLSALTTDSLARAIVSGDAASIAQAQGVGKKSAERVIMELKDKISKNAGLYTDDISSVRTVSKVFAGENCGAAVGALVSLGYSQSEAAAAIGSLDQTMSVEQMIKAGLRLLSN